MNKDKTDPPAPVRVWLDMCADLFHSGHLGAIRQAKKLGDVLVVGIHPDSEVLANKGPPVMNLSERIAMIEACKYVDETTSEAPYQTTLQTLEKFNIDFCVHGEDISTGADGRDSYYEVKQANKFKLIKRTQGVSTTDLVGRMLLLTKRHFIPNRLDLATLPIFSGYDKAIEFKGRNVLRFYNLENKGPKPGEKVVYVDGAFDLFHAAHVNILRQAKQIGYVVVGLLTDQDTNDERGSNLPIMNLAERRDCVSSCKYVDEILVGAPSSILDEEFLKTFGIDVVVHGTEGTPEEKKRYSQLGAKYQEVDSDNRDLSTSKIVQRIIENRMKYEERNRAKIEKDAKANWIKVEFDDKGNVINK